MRENGLLEFIEAHVAARKRPSLKGRFPDYPKYPKSLTHWTQVEIDDIAEGIVVKNPNAEPPT